MVTFAQAQERAEEWINGDVPAYQHREVLVREFGLGFVVWAEDRSEGPRADGGAQRLVIARDSGEATLWPGLPVGEVIRRYEEEYGAQGEAEQSAPAPAARVDLNQTSFLLSPPEWLQEAADKMGIPDRRQGDGGSSSDTSGGTSSGVSSDASGTSGDGGAGAAPVPTAAPVPAAASGPASDGEGSASGTAWPAAGGGDEAPEVAAGATPWEGTDISAEAGEDRSVPLPATVFAPPLSDADGDTPPPVSTPDAKTALLDGGSQLPRTTVAPALDEKELPGTPPSGAATGPGTPPPGGPQTSGVPDAAQPPAGPPVPGEGSSSAAQDIADAATSKAQPPRSAQAGGAPHPPGAPGVPGATPPPGGYVPTQLVSQLGPDGPGGATGPGTPPAGAPTPPGPPKPPGATPPGGAHHAATMLADPNQPGPGQPGPNPPGPHPPGPSQPGPSQQGPSQPGPAPAARDAVHQAATMLAGPPVGAPVGGPGAPPPPPGVPGVPVGAPQPLPGRPPVPVPGQQPSYGYPPPGQPTVGPGYQAVLRYRAQDGSEQQLIRRSAPGTPHPEWQIFHELRAMNVPPDQVLELHTELESCELPGAYCARMIRENWPQARITSIAPYGTDHASRQQGMQQLLAHQGELHQVADGPARPGPVRAPLPQVQPVPPVPPEGIAQEMAGAFGPGVFRFDQVAVSRQGVPPIVAHTLVVAGLPLDMGPFFWAQAQPGRPVPTLAELAQERGVQPAPDAGSYLVVGSDFGKAICVQYGTAAIVAVPVEAGPGGASVPPQFVNSGLPEFVRCMALLGRMWRLRYGLNQEQAGRWTVDFQAQLCSLDPAALGSPESWWSVVLEQMWDGLL
ncbi:SUKH-4 family immunity protein [Streptomyces sp. RY43-2]|uniref:SUKH-4 family immunity protein n=1 Tax=Streptomyces macrolidinus TaxID=2952607 RepID=A0ABT0ZEA6_9ACTN|nr:SUKH-4 family immunity protein [Streptomyces macrolidinus]MCN9241913.1 SUKH-4 family immunity protein [Streptomyces macrolidinus]